MKTMAQHAAPLLYVRQDIGKGRPLVLLHGMFANGSQWRVVAGLLADDFRVIVVDLLGHGRSPAPKGARYTPREHSRALRATLEKLKATEDVTVVGYSMGGPVALKYAADYEGVAQLYLISTPFYLRAEEMVSSGYATSLLYTKISLSLFRLVERMLHPGKLLYILFSSESFTRHMQGVIDSKGNMISPEIARKNLDQLIVTYPFIRELKRVHAPITFYAGKRDVFVIQSQLAALKKIKPLMEIETLGIVKNDHAVVQYLPNQIADVLRRYHDQHLHVAQDTKTGRKVLVLLHGIEGNSAYWDKLVPVLAEKYRVITTDLLGFGASPKPNNVAYTLDDQVAWLHRTLAARGVGSFEIVGHSLGALVAMAYAGTYPREVKEITLVAPVFHDNEIAKRTIIFRWLSVFNYFSNLNYLIRYVTKAIGYRRIVTLIPTARTITNAIQSQSPLALARSIKSKPVTIMYGTRDGFIHESQIKSVIAKLPHARVTELADESHNFALFQPTKFLAAFKPTVKFPAPSSATPVRPRRIIRQLLLLAAPILLAKGFFYLAVGLLLFSPYAKETLAIAVVVLVIFQSIQFIRGSFSLNHEGLSYASYLVIGGLGILAGYALTNRFQLTLTVAVLAVIGYALLNGVSSLLAGWVWTHDAGRRRRLLVKGSLLTIISVAALLGSLTSLYLIVYTIAVYALIRGGILLVYGASTVVLAFIRSYQ